MGEPIEICATGKYQPSTGDASATNTSESHGYLETLDSLLL